MTDLKPCPFCGGKARVMKMGYPHWVYCVKCGAKVHGGVVGEDEGEKASISAWNRRVNTMRLIDADALEPDADYYDGDCLAVSITQIQNAPTIEPERQKGKWILHTYIPHHNYCSECEKDSPYNKRWDFCPNCGADMRGDEE